MAEAERLLAGHVCWVRADQFLAHERGEHALDLRWRLRVAQRQYRRGVEHLPLDGAALEQVTLFGSQPLDARGEQSLDRRRHVELALLARERDHLLQEERVPRARLDQPCLRLRSQTIIKLHDQFRAISLAQRAEAQ